MSLKDDIAAESKQYGGSTSGDFFQFEKGVNKMRILVKPKVIAFHFFGKGVKPAVCIGMDEGCPHHKPESDKPTIKLATYILDRKDEKVKLAELPLSISYSLDDLQEDEDFAFTDFPMPYDVKITHDPDNKDPKAKYRLVGSPKREELNEEEFSKFSEAMKKMTPEQYVQTRKDKQKGGTDKNTEYPKDEINPDDIPF